MYQRPADTIIETALEVKRSRFITLLTRVTDEASARAFIADVVAAYPDARHHCSAYRFHVEGANPVERSSDDGEPSGTAGGPMLETLRGAELLDVAAVVVRYFGGIKLGTGGLARAYTDAVTQALAETPITYRTSHEVYTFAMSHAQAGRVEAELYSRGFTVANVEYAHDANFTVTCPPGKADQLQELLAASSHGKVHAAPAGHTWIDLPAK